MPSTRRRLLASAGTVAAAGLTGCFGGSASSSSPDCTAENFDHANPDVLHGVLATAWNGEQVRFVVTLLNGVDVATLDLISVYDAAGELAFTMPIVAGNGPAGTRRRYEQTLGPRPQTGRYRVVVTDADGEVVDEVTTDVSCFSEPTDAAGTAESERA